MVDGGTASTDFEPTGDIERVLSTAPKVTIYLYVVPTTCTSGEMADAFAKMAVDSATKKFKSINISYGTSEDDIKSSGGTSGETAIDTDLSTLLNTKGVTPFAATGDSGSFESTSSPFWFTPGEITANFPASDPNTMAVGGTSAFTTSSSSSTRLIENAWSGSGGGVSSTWKIPGRQVGVPGIASTTMRNVPDVALNADLNTGYVLNFSGAGGLVLGGGTSFASPGWAGFLALVNQKRAALGKAALTLVPKNIYAQRGTSGFFDIVNGSNGFYSAKAGYDNVTGLGVFDAAKLYASLIALP
jgi:kumamolisin